MKNQLFITLIFLSNFLFAQTGNISGRIVDEQNLPLPGANVILNDTLGFITDVNGAYSIPAIGSGNHLLRVSYLGFLEQVHDIDVPPGKTVKKNVTLQAGLSLQEVVVTDQLKGQAKALNKQLTNYNITNIISSDQVGRFPDQNIGDALKRVPGINVQYDQGEARFGNIRGTAPQLNSVTVNGERIPSAEAEIRSIQLDLIPADMIQMIEVNKAVTPDMDADAIGASVNLVTRAAPYERRISATLGGGYNLLAEKPTLNGSFIFGDRFANRKLGFIFSASYFNNNLGSDNVEPEWTYDDANDNDRYDEGEDYWPEEIQIRQYYLQRIRQSYSASLDYQINPNHTLFLKGIYNQRSDFENRYRSIFKDIEQDGDQWVAELERETKAGTEDIKYARHEDQEMMSYSLSGEHLFGKIKLNWSAAYSKASEDRPNERYYEISSGDVVPITVDFSDERRPYVSATDPAFQNPGDQWEFSSLTEEFQYTEDIDRNARLDLEIPILSGKFRNYLKTGFRYRGKTKNRNNDFYEFEPVNDDVFSSSIKETENFSKDNFLAGNYLAGAFPSREFVGDLNLESEVFEKEQDLSELAGNFDATENISGGYIMLNQNFGSRFSAIGGLRLEQTNLEYEGFVFDDEEGTLNPTAVEKRDYLNFLPGLHLKYNVSPKTVIRAAYTNTIARPNYFDLVPYQQIVDGEELSIGNPALEPTTSTNFDLMAEHYFPSIGLISGGIFFKDIQDFIVTQRLEDHLYNGAEWPDFFQPINGGNAQLFGAEFTIQRQLDFLPGIFKGFGIYANYTYISSEITDFNFEGREDEALPLPRSPEHTLNFSLAYDTRLFSARLSYNYASDFIDELGDEAFGDRYYDVAHYLDFNTNLRVHKNWTVYLNANNLLNQPLRYFQGTPSRTMQAEFYNVRFDLGVKLDL